MGVKRGYKQTEVGVLPEDWTLENIESLAHIATGSKNTQDRVNDGLYPFFVRSQTIERINSYSFDGEAVLTAGDGVGTGKVFHYITGKFDAHQRVYRISDFNERVNGYFFFLYFSSHFCNRIMQMTAKSSVDSVRREMIARMLVPLPPTKAEQEAIAEALSDADALIESLEHLITKKRQVKQGTMQALLTGKKRLPGFEVKPGYKQTEVGVIPVDWDVVVAFDACSKIQDGTHFSPRIGGNEYLYITSKNIRFGHMDVSTASWIDKAQHQAIYRRCDVKKGDLLLTKDGANTGNAALNSLDEEFSLLSSVAFLRFCPRKHCAAYFLYQVLASCGQRQIQDAMAGNAITRLTLEKINTLRFPAPLTKAEQEAIAAILSDMDAEIIALEAKLSKAHQIKQGMMQELLTGRIRLV